MSNLIICDFVDSAPLPDVIKRYKKNHSASLHTFPEHLLIRRFLDCKSRTIASFTIRKATGIEELLAMGNPLAIGAFSFPDVRAVCRSYMTPDLPVPLD